MCEYDILMTKGDIMPVDYYTLISQMTLGRNTYSIILL